MAVCVCLSAWVVVGIRPVKSEELEDENAAHTHLEHISSLPTGIECILCDTSQVNAMAVANSALAYVTDFKAKAASGIRICSGWVLNADGCLAWMRTSGVFVTGG